jgi:hypothetical protein
MPAAQLPVLHCGCCCLLRVSMLAAAHMHRCSRDACLNSCSTLLCDVSCSLLLTSACCMWCHTTGMLASYALVCGQLQQYRDCLRLLWVSICVPMLSAACTAETDRNGCRAVQPPHAATCTAASGCAPALQRMALNRENHEHSNR